MENQLAVISDYGRQLFFCFFRIYIPGGRDIPVSYTHLDVYKRQTKPYSDETARLAREMSESYGVSVLPVNCEQLKKEDVFHILERVLKEFPVTEDVYKRQLQCNLPPFKSGQNQPENPTEGCHYDNPLVYSNDI